MKTSTIMRSGKSSTAANQLVHGLRELGLREGDSFATVLPNGTTMIELYLAALCRQPEPAEQAAMVDYLRHARDRRSAWEDIVWALLNQPAFLFNH